VQASILKRLPDLQRELGVSRLFSTHSTAVVGTIADGVAMMRAGRVVEQGACADVLQRPVDDHTRTLLAAVPQSCARVARAGLSGSGAQPGPAAPPKCCRMARWRVHRATVVCCDRTETAAARRALAAVPASGGSPVAAETNRVCCSFPTAGSVGSRDETLASARHIAA
jgi:ABC-type dipeptide/oligopeptide/nickel transport system ATPase component